MAKKFELASANYTEVKAVAGAAIVAGAYVAQGEITGFAFTDAINGAEYTVIIKAEKVVVEKDAGVTFVAGDALYWDTVGLNVTNAAGALDVIGVAYEAAASADVVATMVFDGTLAYAKA